MSAQVVLVRSDYVFLLGLVIGLAILPSKGTAQSLEQNPTFRENFYDVGIRDNRCWIVGYYGTILHSRDRGLTWEVQTSGTKEALFRVSFVNPENGWISGSYGTILRTRDGGGRWELQQAPTTEHLFGLNFLNERIGWAVGSRGTILYTDNGGLAWVDRSLGEDVILNDVAFINPREGWVVGEFGRIYHTADGGQSWVKQKSPIEVSFISGENRNLFRLLLLRPEGDGKGLMNSWAFGLDGVILKTREGGQWEVVHKNGSTSSAATLHHLFDAEVYSGRKWAVGERGTVVFAGVRDEEWVPVGLDTPPVSLNGIAFGLDGLGLIVGNRGVVLRTEDGGEKWDRIRIVPRGPGKGISRVQ
ncbi:MAG: YCF48-related protein [Deltaproteobacteria bacterium]|nr:YCF48-related protein [Deltaproteobacteria bacterium]